MNDIEARIREAFRDHEGDTPAFDLADARQIAGRTRRRQALNGAMATVVAVAIAVATLAGVDAVRSAPVPADNPAPAPGVMRENEEVLRFTGVIDPYTIDEGDPQAPGDLVAVDPRTGEERVLLEDLTVYSARWSADGRWLAYEIDAADGVGIDLWVAGGSQAPRVVASGGDPDPIGDPRIELEWKWSPTGATLATIEHSERLRTIDVATGETTDLVVADLLPGFGPWNWAWSPDGTRLVFASPDQSLNSVDTLSGERSLLARLPGWMIERIRWSPDGAHIAVQTRVKTRVGDAGHLYVLDADGSDIRLVADDSNSLGFAWSPDGTRLAFGSEVENEVQIRVTTADGAAPVEVGTVNRNPCLRTSYGYNFECFPTWSPDGTQVAFRVGETAMAPVTLRVERKVTVFDAAGAGEARPLDEITFLAWDGGWYQSRYW